MGKEGRKRTERLTLAKAIAQAVAKIPGALGWRLEKRKGRMEVVVELGEKRLDQDATRPLN